MAAEKSGRPKEIIQENMTVKRIKTVRNLKNEVYNILREGIANGSLPPGAPLKEADLVREIGVSRTPIREALNQLSRDGLVELGSRRGASVKSWTREEVLEILLIREALESLATRLAARNLTPEDIDRLNGYMESYRQDRSDYARADRQFHEHIVQASGMDRLVVLIRNLYDSIQMANMLRIIFLIPGRIEESMEEHNGIIEAFRNGDEKAAESCARKHFQQTQAYYMRMIGEDENSRLQPLEKKPPTSEQVRRRR